MAFDPIEYLVQKIRTYDSSIDVSAGSAIRDLMINPLSSMLEPFQDTHRVFENRLSLAQVSGLSESALDDIAANYLVSRTSGSKAAGFVRIYFKSPVNLTIPANTVFKTAAGLKFYSVQEHTVTTTQMLANIDRYPLYHTGNIFVRAETEGSEYQINPLEITTVVGLSIAYDSVANPSAFTGGTAKDTNDELYTKILNSVYNNSLASTKGIATTLKSTFSDIKDVLVVGANDELMLRDLAQDTTRPDIISYVETDFRGKIKGYNESPYVEHRAYYGSFIDENLLNSGFLTTEFPTPTSFSREYTQADYANIFKEDANVTSIVPSKVLVYEDFNASGYDQSWTTSDERMGFGIMQYSGEITVLNGAIYMGNDTANRVGRNLSYHTIAKISGLLNELEAIV